jgi:hypothetical protein
MTDKACIFYKNGMCLHDRDIYGKIVHGNKCEKITHADCIGYQGHKTFFDDDPEYA